MHGYEQYRPQHFGDEQYDSEACSMDSFSHATMESFDFNTASFNHLPYTFAEMPNTYAEAPIDHKFHQMMRSTSTGSTHLASYEMPPALLSSQSVGSSSSSTVGSPYSAHVSVMPAPENFNSFAAPVYLPGPTIVSDERYQLECATDPLVFAEDHKLTASYVDPGLLSGARDTYYSHALSPNMSQPPQHALSVSPAPSPAPSQQSYHSFSPNINLENYGTQQRHHQRRMSISSQRSGNSPRTSVSGDEEGGEKGKCPFPDCKKSYKDLRAHMVTHQEERPEKCPIPGCPYNIKGFARKYDKNRHTLIHFKGTMVCGFCPGSGSPAEKSFNRTDVFKRHLTSLHNVERDPPNSRKRSPGTSTKKLSSYCEDATGKCSNCAVTFSNAQDFYNHLEDCVLRVVQQEDPREAVNAMHLGEMKTDPAVLETMERNNVKMEDVPSLNFDEEDEEDDDEDNELDDDEDEDSCGRSSTATATKKRAIIGGNITKKSKSKRGLTWSKGGVPLTGRGRRRRKNFPPSWGKSAEKMKKKKRVLCVYDGSRRLHKDDMMLNNEHEVRIRLADGENYVTDLDVETMKRANAFHNATEEEKGTWFQEDFLEDLMR